MAFSARFAAGWNETPMSRMFVAEETLLTGAWRM